MEYLGDVILPSARSAEDFVERKPGSTLTVGACTIFRAALASAGLALAGVKGKKLFYGSLFASIAIESFVIGYIIYARGKENVYS